MPFGFFVRRFACAGFLSIKRIGTELTVHAAHESNNKNDRFFCVLDFSPVRGIDRRDPGNFQFIRLFSFRGFEMTCFFYNKREKLSDE